MSNIRFPASLRPIVNKGYSQVRGGNIWRNEVQGGAPRQGRDTYFEPVPLSITLVVSALGRQAFWSFVNNIDGGASSFIMPNDTGYGVQDHLVWITSAINDSTDDGKNWTISFTATAERTAIQEDNCLTANLPDLFGCYGDCLGGFLKAYGVSQTTFPRIWGDFPVLEFNYLDHALSPGMSLTRTSTATYVAGGVLKSAAVNEPRFEDNGLLIEGLSTNEYPLSENFLASSGTRLFIYNANLLGSLNADNSTTFINNAGSPNTTGSAARRMLLSSSMPLLPSTQYTISFMGKGGGHQLNIYGTALTTISTNITFPNSSQGVASATFTTNSSAGGTFQFELYANPMGSDHSTYAGSFDLRYVQLEVKPYATSYIKTNGAAVTRHPDNLATTLSNIKRLRRVYIPAGQTTAIDETVTYTGTLCPNGHLQLLQLWDTE